jgi:hypothetical protein
MTTGLSPEESKLLRAALESAMKNREIWAVLGDAVGPRRSLDLLRALDPVPRARSTRAQEIVDKLSILGRWSDLRALHGRLVGGGLDERIPLIERCIQELARRFPGRHRTSDPRTLSRLLLTHRGRGKLPPSYAQFCEFDTDLVTIHRLLGTRRGAGPSSEIECAIKERARERARSRRPLTDMPENRRLVAQLSRKLGDRLFPLPRASGTHPRFLFDGKRDRHGEAPVITLVVEASATSAGIELDQAVAILSYVSFAEWLGDILGLLPPPGKEDVRQHGAAGRRNGMPVTV